MDGNALDLQNGKTLFEEFSVGDGHFPIAVYFVKLDNAMMQLDATMLKKLPLDLEAKAEQVALVESQPYDVYLFEGRIGDDLGDGSWGVFVLNNAPAMGIKLEFPRRAEVDEYGHLRFVPLELL
jgi:hypothetical protein